jgi:uncharacterized protein (TIGR03118 family)
MVFFLKPLPLLSACLLLIFSSCIKIRERLDNFEQVNLVANTASYGAARVDPAFINGWGLDFSPFGPAFIANPGSHTCVAYGTDGAERRAPISIPGSSELGGAPSGVVFNGSDFFQLQNFAPARFIFAGLDGVISAWNEGDVAETVKNNAPTAVYTGLAIAQDAGAYFLYVANFSEGRIQVYDGAFNEVVRSFADPSLPAGYSPYNIQQIDGRLYVMYAKAAPAGVEAGAGKGYVNIFNADGSLYRRFISGGRLNAPWGIAKASPTFWNFSINEPSAILVGNFGDGRINAYSQNGNFLATLRTETGPIEIEGLWGISFAPDSVVAEHGKLFFAAGPNGEQDGLFGYIHNVDE